MRNATAMGLCSCILALLWAGEPARAAPAASPDFDFAIGVWFADPARWMRIRGHATVRKVWGGRGNLEETEAAGPHGPFEGLTLRLYDPATRQWRLYWANSGDGVNFSARLTRVET